MPRHNFRTLREAQSYIRDNNLPNAGIYLGNEGAGERTYEYPLNEVVISTRRPKSAPPKYQYASSFNGSMQNFNDVINAMTGGIANRFDITQNARALYDTYQFARGNMSREDWQNSLVYGNNGIVSDKYAQEHPIMAMLANSAGSMLPIGAVAGSTYRTLRNANAAFANIASKAIDRNMLPTLYRPT